MEKTLSFAVHFLAAGIMLIGTSPAQQTPAANPQPAAPAKTQTSPAAKAHTATPAKTQSAPPLTTLKDKFSYALGMKMGANLHKQAVEVDPNVMLRGLKDGLAGGKTQLTDDQATAALQEVSNQLRKQAQEKMQATGEENKRQGAAFLAANKTKDGVITLPSGLQYKVLKQGTGPKPGLSDTVVCNYRGTLINGTEFDSSYKRGQPATFPINGIIKGWMEALPLMPVGSKWQLFIPAELGYAEHSPSPDIGPDSTLIFEVELLSIQDKTAQKPPPPAPTTPDKNPAQAPDKPADSNPAQAPDKPADPNPDK
jgi:FKBP-type peptidyl-prolyl cis-trans isomerase FklB